MRQIFYKSVVLAACLTLLSISSCKKDDDAKISNNISKRTPVNDPDVEVQNINFNINTNISSSYLDTVFTAFNLDFDLSIYKYGSGPSYNKYISIYTYFTSDLFLQNEVVFRVGQRSDYFLPSFIEGYKIDTYKYAWVNLDEYDNIYGSMYVKNDYGSFGINGFGDRFIPFRKKTGSSYQYGYLKLNLSADADNLIIKSIAYCAVPDKTIYFGDF